MIADSDILQAHILIVDDQEANVALLTQMLLDTGYSRISSTMQPTEVASLHQQHRYDLILLDMQMPEMDGFQVMQELKKNLQDAFLPVIVITAQPAHKVQALQMGARDFVSKPFDLTELRFRIRNMLEVQLLYKLLELNNKELETRVALRTAELAESEARFRSLTELASDWYWEQDDTGNFTKITGPVLEMLGTRMDNAPAEAQDSRFAELPNGGWDAVQHEELKTRIEAREPFLDFLLCRTRGDGAVQRFHISGEPMFDRLNTFIGYRGIGLEVTDRP
ncbi:response regulator [Rhodoferax lacus]|uniref:Response regulator n=1 Tax=Rhodoferax lacus TaxID=2184758 RepID=A0A3E1RCR0_9BURK|nr:response regulator [Rhodoferax lacus]RFO97154.1 response regulator [Rhodoferax lacus]